MREPFKKLKIKIITLSDRAFKGEYTDRSGPIIVEILDNYFRKTDWKYEISTEIIPDEAAILEKILLSGIHEHYDVIITTGGTGVGLRDMTPEVMKKIISKELPGIMENIRIKYGSEKPNALLSRGIAGVTATTQLYSLPGSTKAVNEYMTEILKTIEHLFFMIHGIDIH